MGEYHVLDAALNLTKDNPTVGDAIQATWLIHPTFSCAVPMSASRKSGRLYGDFIMVVNVIVVGRNGYTLAGSVENAIIRCGTQFRRKLKCKGWPC